MVAKFKHAFKWWRHDARLDALRKKGMHIGRDVSTSFGPECALVAHDPALEESHGVPVVGTITLHPSTHVGARTIVGPGVEVGPRTIIAAGSVVSRSLPPDTVCWGNPARPYSTLEQYLETHQTRAQSSRRFAYMDYSIQFLDEFRRSELVAAAEKGDAYIVGGRSAEIGGTGGSVRTPRGTYVPPEPRSWSEDPRLRDTA